MLQLTYLLTLLLCAVTFLQNTAPKPFNIKLAEAAYSLTSQKVTYDPAYFSIPYPNGDVPADKGVCTDVVIRAYRKLGIDLQKLVHEDMQAHFSSYPKLWGLKKTDANIDHRRVQNLMVFFKKFGKEKTTATTPAQYLPGDIVVWDVGQTKSTLHIGIVSNKINFSRSYYQVVHNIGGGQVLENVLFEYPIKGHYSFQ
jgi:hypothetical protein